MLYNADDITEVDFLVAWGNVNLVPVTNWGAMVLSNAGDTIGIWDSFAAYNGDNATQANVIDQVAYDDGTTWPADRAILSVSPQIVIQVAGKDLGAHSQLMIASTH